MTCPCFHRRRAWRRTLTSRACSSYVLSGLFHGGLIVAAVFVMVGEFSPLGPHQISAEWSRRVHLELDLMAQDQGLRVPEPASQSIGTVIVHHGESQSADLPRAVLDEPDAEVVDDSPPRGAAWLTAAASRPAGPADNRERAVGSGPRGIESFFGIPAGGGRIVYVVDCSGSMAAPHREAPTRFHRLKLELHRSIGSLGEHREFFVIFFNHSSIPMPARELQRASPENKQKFRAWIDEVPAEGSTEPAAALRYALRLKPDTIFLLSDGSFSPRTQKLLSVLNRDQVTIHTLGFSEESNAALLEGIAKAHGGTYRFVP